MPDKDDHPTEEELGVIREWDVVKAGVCGLLDEIQELWKYTDTCLVLEGGHLDLHTSGWSGNEAIIQALADNLMFWYLCWQKSERGGHYVFEIPEALFTKGDTTVPI